MSAQEYLFDFKALGVKLLHAAGVGALLGAVGSVVTGSMRKPGGSDQRGPGVCQRLRLEVLPQCREDAADLLDDLERMVNFTRPLVQVDHLAHCFDLLVRVELRVGLDGNYQGHMLLGLIDRLLAAIASQRSRIPAVGVEVDRICEELKRISADLVYNISQSTSLAVMMPSVDNIH